MAHAILIGFPARWQGQSGQLCSTEHCVPFYLRLIIKQAMARLKIARDISMDDQSLAVVFASKEAHDLKTIDIAAGFSKFKSVHMEWDFPYHTRTGMRIHEVYRSVSDSVFIDTPNDGPNANTNGEGKESEISTKTQLFAELFVGELVHKISDSKCQVESNAIKCCNKPPGGEGCPECPDILQDMQDAVMNVIAKEFKDDISSSIVITFEREGQKNTEDGESKENKPLAPLGKMISYQSARSLTFGFPSCNKDGVRIIDIQQDDQDDQDDQDASIVCPVQNGDYVISIGTINVKETMKRHIDTRMRLKYGITIVEKDGNDKTLKINENGDCPCDQCTQLNKNKSKQDPAEGPAVGPLVKRLLFNTKQHRFGESRKTRTFKGRDQVTKPSVMIRSDDDRTVNLLQKADAFRVADGRVCVHGHAANNCKNFKNKTCADRAARYANAVPVPQFVTVRDQCRCEQPKVFISDHKTGSIALSSDVYEADIKWTNVTKCNLGKTERETGLDDPEIFYWGCCKQVKTANGEDSVVFEQYATQKDAPPKAYQVATHSPRTFSAGAQFALPESSADFWKVVEGGKEYDAVHVWASINPNGVLYVIDNYVPGSENTQYDYCKDLHLGDMETLQEAPRTQVTADKRIKVTSKFAGEPVTFLADPAPNPTLDLKAVVQADGRVMSYPQTTRFVVCAQPQIKWLPIVKHDRYTVHVSAQANFTFPTQPDEEARALYGVKLSVNAPKPKEDVYFYKTTGADDNSDSEHRVVARYKDDPDSWLTCSAGGSVGGGWTKEGATLTKELLIAREHGLVERGDNWDMTMNVFVCRPEFLPAYVTETKIFEACAQPMASLTQLYSNGVRIMDHASTEQPVSVESIVCADLTADVDFMFKSTGGRRPEVKWYTSSQDAAQATDKANRLKLTYPAGGGPTPLTAADDIKQLSVRAFRPQHVPVKGVLPFAVSTAPSIVQDFAAVLKAGIVTFQVAEDDAQPGQNKTIILYSTEYANGVTVSEQRMCTGAGSVQCRIKPSEGKVHLKAIAWSPGKMLSAVVEQEFESVTAPVLLTKWTGHIVVNSPDAVVAVCSWGKVLPVYPLKRNNLFSFEYSGAISPYGKPTPTHARKPTELHVQFFKDGCLPSPVVTSTISVEQCQKPTISVDLEGLMRIEHDTHCQIIYSISGDLLDGEGLSPDAVDSEGINKYTSPVEIISTDEEGVAKLQLRARAYRPYSITQGSEHVGFIPSNVVTLPFTASKCRKPEVKLDVDNGTLVLKGLDDTEGYIVYYTVDGKSLAKPSLYDSQDPNEKPQRIRKYCPSTDGPHAKINMLEIESEIRARAYKTDYLPSGTTCRETPIRIAKKKTGCS